MGAREAPGILGDFSSLASNGLRFLSMVFERGQEMSTPLLGTLS